MLLRVASNNSTENYDASARFAFEKTQCMHAQFAINSAQRGSRCTCKCNGRSTSHVSSVSLSPSFFMYLASCRCDFSSSESKFPIVTIETRDRGVKHCPADPSIKVLLDNSRIILHPPPINVSTINDIY